MLAPKRPIPMTTSTPLARVLLAAAPAQPLADVLGADGYHVLQADSGRQATRLRAHDGEADLILVAAELPDMRGVELCRILHDELRLGFNVPLLILTRREPTPEERVGALSAGAWDCVRCADAADLADLRLKLRVYVQAKRNIDEGLAESFVDPVTKLHTRPGLARRARELGALMARQHGALACVVFAFADAPSGSQAAGAVSRTARLSDVVGVLGPDAYAVLAPATNAEGAVRLAHRVAAMLRHDEDPVATAPAIRVGYEAVANLRYAPLDPVTLLLRAAAALEAGRPEPDAPWLRRFDPSAAASAPVPA